MSTALGFVKLENQQGHIEVLRYDVFVAALFKLESFRHMADHARAGCCEEAGELSSWIKKAVVYGTPLDKLIYEGNSNTTLQEKILEEMGDLRFYLQALQNLFHISEQELLQYNANKLASRYAGLTYSDEAAQKRADKNEQESGNSD